MDEDIIKKHNEVVGKEDTVIHAGDYTFIKDRSIVQRKYIDRLNGNHIFLKGSHDPWLPYTHRTMYELKLGDIYIVVCHYAMRVWPRSHYNSWMLYGHSHGKLAPQRKQWDIGIDNNNFYPISLDKIAEIMLKQPDNFNLVKNER